MAQFASVMPEYVSTYLNAPQNVGTWLNIAECLWIFLKMSGKTVKTMQWLSMFLCLTILDILQGFEYVSGSKYVRVLNMPRF